MADDVCLSRERLEDLLAERLCGAEEEWAAAHLAACDTCRAAAEVLLQDDLLGRERGAWRTDRPAMLPAELRDQLYAMWQPGRETLTEIGATLEWDESITGANERQVGRFRLERVLGAGAFGVVYLAHDPLLKRAVALKLPRLPALVDPGRRARFVREAQAAAGLHHPNIVPVFEADTAGELCYLATAYCAGPTLQQWHKEQKGNIAPATAVHIVRPIAQAVEHAHQRGILHRDLKPSNVLLAPDRKSAGLRFAPMLTDFGLARIMDRDAGTSTSGLILGTPRYMAPEQAAGRTREIGPATDVYALGAILYELLTGQPPLVGTNDADTLRCVVAEEPVPARRLAPSLPRDLEAICRKCLEKLPRHRYASAQELADDLGRFLAGQPTAARPIGMLESGWRFARRRPALAALLAAVVMAAAVFTGQTVRHNVRLVELTEQLDRSLAEVREARDESEETSRRMAELLYVADVKLAAQALREGDLPTSRSLLERTIPMGGARDLRGFEWHYLMANQDRGHVIIAEGNEDVYTVLFSPEGRFLLATGKEAVVRFYDLETRAESWSLDTGQVETNGIAFSPDGTRLATCGDDGTVRLWDWRAGEETLRIAAHSDKAYAAVFTPDGESLVTCGNESVVRLWDVRNGSPRGNLEGHTADVEMIALAPDGRTLGSASADGTARLWDMESRRVRMALTGHHARVNAIAFSPDGRLVATAGIDARVRLWDAATGKDQPPLQHLDAIHSVAFSPDGRTIASGDRRGTFCVWRAGRDWHTPGSDPPPLQGSSQPETRLAHGDRVWTVAFSPDGRRLASAGSDGSVRLWNATLRSPVAREVENNSRFAFIGASDRMVLRQALSLAVWDPDGNESPTRLDFEEHPWKSVAATPDGRRLVTGGVGTIAIWDAQSLAPLERWELDAESRVNEIAFLSEESGLLAAQVNGVMDSLYLFEFPSGRLTKRIALDGCDLMRFAPDQRSVAFCQRNDVVILDAADWSERCRLQGHGGTVEWVCWSPDGRLIASASQDRTVRLWDVATGVEIRTLAGHRSPVNCVAVSPDGRTLVSGDAEGRLLFWHTVTGQELMSVRQTGSIGQISFHGPRRLFATEGIGRLLVLDASE